MEQLTRPVPTTRRPVAAAATLLAIALVGVAACASDNYPVLMIRNATDRTVDLILVYAGGAQASVATLDPGVEYPYSAMGTCLDATLVARDGGGVEIDRVEGPLCRPSVIVLDGVAPNPSG